jgi:hypothetical protein
VVAAIAVVGSLGLICHDGAPHGTATASTGDREATTPPTVNNHQPPGC